MRFLADGPSIPDELLTARDEGRVIFFCGAGVSRARAGLPGFFGLAQKVIDALGVTSNSQAKRLMDVVQEIESRTGISGLVYADRIFGLLEREFSVRDIQAEVAKALQPAPNVDLSAHQILLDLAKGPNGEIRLVTTNFDRLFESCDSSLESSSPPRLPDPQHYENLEGIIHLHGRVDENYNGADGLGFVLSTSEFGRAYLADGWATRFIRAILDRYFVVFIGYTADDPPVQYLLEALNRSLGSRDGLYAFQGGSSSEAESRWRHKGVQPIVYDEGENHRALWDTLREWAIRAQNSDAWYDNVIALTQKGPEALLPFERGQVAHVVSTLPGVKKFSASPTPPPADWLCVLDPSFRYSKPGHIWDSNGQGPFFDPFDAYCLDSDPIPSKIDPDDVYSKRDIPENVWDCFAATRLDRQNLRDEHFAGLRGHWATHVPRLPSRLAQLGVWICRVSNQPAAVWWASGQTGIHPDIQFDIQFHLARAKEPCSPEIRKAWRYIFEAWETQESTFNRDWFNLKDSIRLDGWSNAAVRELALIHRPHLTCERHWSTPKPPTNIEELRVKDVVHLDVKYPSPNSDVEIPDEFLPTAVREFRKNLEHAVSLEKELGGYGLEMLVSLEPDPNLKGNSLGRTYGVSGALLFYVYFFKKLLNKDVENAKLEALAWPTDDDTVFALLRIWACGDHRTFSRIEAGKLFCSLNDRTFWRSRHQRGLLLVVARRWSDLPIDLKTELGKRLLQGPPQWENEEKAEYTERRAWYSLTRIHWLKSHGCDFNFDFDTESAKLRRQAPKWEPQYAEKADASMEGHGGWVQTNTEHAALLTVPLRNLLDKAKELSGRTDDILIEKNPFAGLSSKRPARAFAALTHSAKVGDYPEWAWKTFLNADGRKSDKPKFSALIAERIARLPTNVLAQLIYILCEWLLMSSGVLLRKYPKQFERVWGTLVSVIKFNSENAHSAIIRGSRDPDWAMESLNAPSGKLAEALMNDPQSDDLKIGNRFPAPWIARVNELLSLDGDLRRQAVVIFARRLNWFFAIDPAWTERNLISLLDTEGDDQNAVWAGFFWQGKVPNQELYLQLKPRLLKLARRKSISRRGHGELLTGMLLAGWASENVATGERCVTDTEMRDVLVSVDDDLRSQTLWQVERWSSDDNENKTWAKQLPIFLTNVWPRQRSAKSSRITAALCDLALSDMVRFSERVDLILPLVTTLDQQYTGLHQLENEIVEQHAEKVLKLLFAVLPEDPAMWPYGSGDLLERLETAAASLLKDRRLVELKRRWNSR
jgi:hypothetical protein